MAASVSKRLLRAVYKASLQTARRAAELSGLPAAVAAGCVRQHFRASSEGATGASGRSLDTALCMLRRANSRLAVIEAHDGGFQARPASVRFRVGDVVRRRESGGRLLIVGWDSTCQASPEWQIDAKVDCLAHGVAQPFYHCLEEVTPADDSRDDRIDCPRLRLSKRTSASSLVYVPQEECTVDLCAEVAPPFAHPSLPIYFTSAVPDAARSGRLKPVPALEALYADDSAVGYTPRSPLESVLNSCGLLALMGPALQSLLAVPVAAARSHAMTAPKATPPIASVCGDDSVEAPLGLDDIESAMSAAFAGGSVGADPEPLLAAYQ